MDLGRIVIICCAADAQLARIHLGGPAAARHHDVPPVAGGVFRLGDGVVIARDQSSARVGVEDRLEDRVQVQQRVTRKVHLGDQALGERGSEHREVDVRRAPRVAVVTPRVRAGLDGQEAEGPVAPGEAAPGAGEVRIQGRRVRVALVAVAPGGVGLPDLDQLAGHRSARPVDQPSGDDDALPDRFSGMAGGEVGVAGMNVVAAEAGRPAFELLGVDEQRGARGVAQRAAAVRRVVQPRLGIRALGPVIGGDRCDLRRDVLLRRDIVGVHVP
ncbi:hypothetical protein BN971_04895 [Mycobacterium bohemicum DSM 44277]|uniref:Uncharacterized protein n=1 Tax=Mycobacterium bohemicum DSM 44277 TaxID=1236609 RepID=A0A0U0WFL8_MYCBE|nr:hypothetical protein BN971_04895 [Mycobacterium bohemicum DSM 44277]